MGLLERLSKWCNRNKSTCWFDKITLFGKTYDWTHCSEYHDKLYMTEQGAGLTRAEADDRFFECIKKQLPAMAYIMWIGVRVYGWYFWNKYAKLRKTIKD